MSEKKTNKNLKPIKKGQLSTEEAKKRGSNGGKNSVKKRREKKELKEIFAAFLEMNTPDKMKTKVVELFPALENDHLSMKITLVGAMIKKILEGDVKAFELMRDTIGEKPIEKVTGLVGVQKVFITPREHKETLEHIKNVVDEQS